MEDSDDSLSFEHPTNEADNTLNQTRNSANDEGDNELTEHFKTVLSPRILLFYENLKCTFKLDDLDTKKELFMGYEFKVIPPIQHLYFLPYTILLPIEANLNEIRDNIIRELHPDSVRYNREQEELIIRIHNNSEIVFYSIRCLKTNMRYHKDITMLDERLLVRKLYEYYECIYKELQFGETVGLMMYWAYRKELLQEGMLSEEIIIMVVIWAFLNFGYGVHNIIYSFKKGVNYEEKVKYMTQMSKIDKKGGMEINEELVRFFYNYTIKEKKGFFLLDKNAYMKIKKIFPVHYPLSPAEYGNYQREAKGSIEKTLANNRESLSLCTNLYKIFRFLSKKFNKTAILTIDMSLAHGRFDSEEYFQEFQLDIIHPVLGHNISKHLKEGSLVRRIKAEIEQVEAIFTNCDDSVQGFFQMFRIIR